MTKALESATEKLQEGWSEDGWFWKTIGSGSRDVLFLHGGPGADHRSLLPLAPLFQEIGDWRLIFFDQEACGKSRGNPFRWTLESLSKKTLALAKELDCKNPIIFGHSFGGFLAQEIMTRNPHFSDTLILSSTGARANGKASSLAFHRLGGKKAADAYNAFFHEATEETWYNYRCYALPHYNTTHQATSKTRSDLLFYFWNGERKKMDYRSDLQKIRAETLILVGEEDPVTPPSLSKEINSYLKRGHLKVIPGAGHGVWRDKEDAFLETLQEFLLPKS